MVGLLITDEPETLNIFCGIVRDFLFVDFNGSELVMGDYNVANKGIPRKSYCYDTNIVYY